MQIAHLHSQWRTRTMYKKTVDFLSIDFTGELEAT